MLTAGVTARIKYSYSRYRTKTHNRTAAVHVRTTHVQRVMAVVSVFFVYVTYLQPLQISAFPCMHKQQQQQKNNCMQVSALLSLFYDTEPVRSLHYPETQRLYTYHSWWRQRPVWRFHWEQECTKLSPLVSAYCSSSTIQKNTSLVRQTITDSLEVNTYCSPILLVFGKLLLNYYKNYNDVKQINIWD